MTLQRALVTLGLMLAFARPALAADPLPSWKAGNARKAIVSFVEQFVKAWMASARHPKTGRLARVLDEAPGRGWIVASMRNDWTLVFPGLAAKT